MRASPGSLESSAHAHPAGISTRHVLRRRHRRRGGLQPAASALFFPPERDSKDAYIHKPSPNFIGVCRFYVVQKYAFLARMCSVLLFEHDHE
uniref:Uncharacterized protein n=1 Tax=Oryza meridionalis TaxID=40149 RepID=A0A1V1H5L1_9ORYZ|nr:hypothetical protein [Oryza meridionalis]